MENKKPEINVKRIKNLKKKLSIKRVTVLMPV